MFAIKRKSNKDDLGEDTVYTGADIKAVKHHIDAVKEQAQKLKDDLNNLFSQNSSNFDIGSTGLGQIPVSEALAEIEQRTIAANNFSKEEEPKANNTNLQN